LTAAELAASDGPEIKAISKDSARALLKRVLASDVFVGSPRLCELLEYLVFEVLEGRGERIKGFTIAQEVFKRTDPEDAQTSTIVSVEARRLRRKLAEYFDGEGQDETFEICIPKGSYVPEFLPRTVPNEPVQNSTEKLLQGEPAKTGLRIGIGRGLWGVLALLILGLSSFYWLGGFNRAEQTSEIKPLLIVLPFNNLTNEASLDEYASGVAEDITSALAAFSELEIIAQSSVSQLKLKDTALEDISLTFQATHAVYGTVRGRKPKYRIGVELVEIETGKLIWANRFERNLTDPIGTQLEIANHVARALPVTLSKENLVAQRSTYEPAPDTKALFEQAMDLANPPSDPNRLNLAKSAFGKVVEADHNFAGGYAGLAYVEAFKGLFLVGESTPASIEAHRLAKTALELDPTNALALNAQAFADLLSGNFKGALVSSAKAVEFNPNDPYALAYHGFIHAANGDPEAGIPFVETALVLDPLEPRTPYLNILGTIKFQNHDYAGAIEAFQENQRRSGPNGEGTRATLAASYVAINERDSALNLIRTLPDGYVNGRWLTWRLMAFNSKDDAEKGPKMLAQFIHEIDG
jgi:adenylate cyclase